jgi:hypothetical protein
MKSEETSGEACAVSLVESENQYQFGGSVRVQAHTHARVQLPTPEPEPNDDQLRCLCGALLARWVAAGLELKCRRCKRTTLIPYPARTSFTRSRST